MNKKTKDQLIGVGTTAALVAASYFLYGSKEGKKRRTQIRGWMMKAKGEVLDKMERLNKLDKKSYNELVDSVTTKYKKLGHVETKEVVELARDLKRHWDTISKQIEEGEKKTSRGRTKKPARQTKK